MTFSSLGLCKPILKSINEKGYSAPYPIQLKAIPSVLSGKDIMAAAQTGTGKTASFTLPLLQRLSDGPKVKGNHIRSLFLAPTRELAIQISESISLYSKYLLIKSGVVYGGVAINPQMMKLRGGVDLLVATPGRLLDLYNKNAVKFSQLESLVLDEADRMLDMGFIEDIHKILALLPKKRQNLLFSATFSKHVRKLAGNILINPQQIEVTPRNSTANTVKQWIYEVDKTKKGALLSHLLRKRGWEQVLVFTRTKKSANRLVTRLERDGISAAAIHSDKSQSQRTRTLASFKANKIRVLIATDLASRGLDINQLPQVINFDLPKVPEDYIHRIGRTGRAGSKGDGISLVSADEVELLSKIENLIRHILVREVETDFIPTHSVPLTHLVKLRPKKTKKNKQPKQSPQLGEKKKKTDSVQKNTRKHLRPNKFKVMTSKKGKEGRGKKKK